MESSLKMMRNAFNSILNARFILEIFIFFTIFCYIGKQLDKKVYDVTNFMMSQTG